MNAVAARGVAVICAGCVSYLGLDFRLAPALIAVSSAFLVRVPLFKPHKLLHEACWTLLGMLGAFVTVADQRIGSGPAFWTGIGFGAIASSLLQVGKSIMTGPIKERLQAAAKIMLGIGDKP